MKRVNGPLLRSLRQKRGLNVIELSSASDVDRRTISSYERQSPEKIDLNTVLKLATFFDLALDELLIDSSPESASVSRQLASA